MKNVRNFRLFQPQQPGQLLPAGQGQELLPVHGSQQQRRPGVYGRGYDHRQQGGKAPGNSAASSRRTAQAARPMTSAASPGRQNTRK